MNKGHSGQNHCKHTQGGAHLLRVAEVVSTLRNGSWVSRSRLRVYPVMLLMGFSSALIWLYLGGGSSRWAGADFVGFWAPARLAVEGRAAHIYDPFVLQQLQQSISGSPGYLPWPYPPTYLLLILPLGLIPYWYAFVVWEGVSLATYWLSVRRHVDSGGILLAAAFPAVWIAIINGHAEHMLAGLFGAGLFCMDRRPIAAGILIGLCAIKPHLFLLVPVALIVTAQWRVVLIASITIGVLSAASLLGLGLEPWRAFLGEAFGLGSGVANASFAEIVTKQQSTFAYAASVGGAGLAVLAQAIVTAVTAATVAVVWQRHRALEIRAITLCCATLLATPYLWDYDLALLAVPIALVARRGMQVGFYPWEKSLLAALWLLPLAARPVSVAHIPITPILLGVSLFVFARFPPRPLSGNRA